MKVIDFSNYSNSPVPNWCLYLLKFRKRSVVEFSVEEQCVTSFPSILLQIGPETLLYLSVGLFKFHINLTLWGPHYEW